MPEVRNTALLVHIEATFAAALREVIKNDQSLSSYIRNLIIQDLINRGVLDEKALKKVLVG